MSTENLLVRKLTHDEYYKIEELINSRSSKKLSFGLGNINEQFIESLRQKENFENPQREIWGLFEDNILDIVTFSWNINDYEFYWAFTISRKNITDNRERSVEKWNFFMKEVFENKVSKGYTTHYAIIPTTKERIGPENTPGNIVNLKWTTTILEIVLSGELPKIPLHRIFLNRLLDGEVAVIRRDYNE